MTDCGPLINMRLLVELQPQFHSMSIYRLNTAKAKGHRLPEPDLIVGGVSLWYLDTIREWADRLGRELDADVLARICQSQTVE